MTLGRAATFMVILCASLAIAGTLIRRHRAHRGAVEAAPGPSPSTASRPRPSVSEARRPPLPALPRSAAPPLVEEDPLSAALCPEGMLLSEGTTCAEHARRCAEAGTSGPESCERWEPAECRRGLSVKVCIDRFEYPNVEGMLPATLVTFEQARAACEAEDKRLCTETEWAFACAGPRGFAFPYGDTRDDGACNVSKHVERVRPEDLWEARDIAPAVERADARSPIGAFPGCVSQFGVRDLVGNVEEWVTSDTPGFAAALRGGEYTSAPTCGAVRQIRQSAFRQLHTGFRCCRDPQAQGRDRSPEPPRNSARPVAPPGGFD